MAHTHLHTHDVTRTRTDLEAQHDPELYLGILVVARAPAADVGDEEGVRDDADNVEPLEDGVPPTYTRTHSQ